MYLNYQLGDLSKTPYSKQDYDMFRYMLAKCEVNGAPGYSTFGAQGYTVCERWHTFSNFLEDLTKINNFQSYFYNRSGYELAITNNSKEFNADNCEFVSNSINDRMKNNKPGKYSQFAGVTMNDGSYQAFVTIDGTKYYLGCYDDEIAAANMYNAILFACTDNKSILNEVPFMPVYECLKHRTSNTRLDTPPQVHIDEIDKYNASIKKYRGVKNITGSSHFVQFNYNKTPYSYGSFDSAIAAANAYNWYASYGGNYPGIKLNNLAPDEYMSADEWLKHRVYSNASKYKKPVNMVKFIDEPKEEQDKRCLKHYGMIFN